MARTKAMGKYSVLTRNSPDLREKPRRPVIMDVSVSEDKQ